MIQMGMSGWGVFIFSLPKKRKMRAHPLSWTEEVRKGKVCKKAYTCEPNQGLQCYTWRLQGVNEHRQREPPKDCARFASAVVGCSVMMMSFVGSTIRGQYKYFKLGRAGKRIERKHLAPHVCCWGTVSGGCLEKWRSFRFRPSSTLTFAASTVLNETYFTFFKHFWHPFWVFYFLDRFPFKVAIVVSVQYCSFKLTWYFFFSTVNLSVHSVGTDQIYNQMKYFCVHYLQRNF